MKFLPKANGDAAVVRESDTCMNHPVKKIHGRPPVKPRRVSVGPDSINPRPTVGRLSKLLCIFPRAPERPKDSVTSSLWIPIDSQPLGKVQRAKILGNPRRISPRASQSFSKMIALRWIQPAFPLRATGNITGI